MNLILSLGIVNNCTLERESTLEVINENLSLADHIDFVSKKVNQRFGVLRRIKHLLGSIFGFDSAFIGLSIFLHALKY